MFKIGEFSKITQVSVRMLRYYEEQKLLSPACIDPSNGYRLYSAHQIEELNRIVLMRNLGFDVKEMKELLMNWKPELLKGNLLEKMKRTEEEIRTRQQRMEQIPAQHVISLRRIVADYYWEENLWRELGEKVCNMNISETTSSFSIYHDTDYREQEVDIEVCIASERKPACLDSSLCYRQIEKVDFAACFMVYGSYSNISIAYKEFAFWLEQHPEYCMSGENRQICHVSACHTSDPKEYITELQIPLKSEICS